MTDIYKQLGFKQPEFLENPYGIKIYMGTAGEDDWCVVIPKELAKMKCSNYNVNHDFAVYLVSEQHALETAKLYTELARKLGVNTC